jgi:hypothetical protein
MFGAWVGGVLRWRANTSIASTWTSPYTPWKYFLNLEATSQKCEVMGAKYVQTDGVDILHARFPNPLILKLILFKVLSKWWRVSYYYVKAMVEQFDF